MLKTEVLQEAYSLLNNQLNLWDSETPDHRPEVSLRNAVDALPISREVKERLSNEVWGWGPLSALIEDPEVTEIVVNGPQQLFSEKNGTLHEHQHRFLNEICYQNFVHFVCSLIGAPLTTNLGFVEGRWQQLRIHVVSGQLTRLHDVVTIRKARAQGWDMAALVERGFLSCSESQFLVDAVLRNQTIIVCGPTNSGKTSLLSALLGTLPRYQRAILLEETSEIPLPNPCSIALEARPNPKGDLSEISLERLVKEALRMRPDRLVVGEIRGREAKDLLLALSTGHRGGFSTLHASSAREAITRLEILIQMGAPTWPLQTIRKILASSLQILVTTEKLKDGTRAVTAIHQVASMEEQGITLDPLFIREEKFS